LFFLLLFSFHSPISNNLSLYIREIEKNRREIEKNRREQERMKEETRINEKIVDYINTFGANNFEMLSRTQKERLFEIGE
jgi:hypothetical protein